MELRNTAVFLTCMLAVVPEGLFAPAQAAPAKPAAAAQAKPVIVAAPAAKAMAKPAPVAAPAKPGARNATTNFVLTKPTPEYNEFLKKARASHEDEYWKIIAAKPEGPTYENIKDLPLAPIRYTDAPWIYAGIILSPKGSTQKMRLIENGFRVDANLTRRSKAGAGKSFTWAAPDTALTLCVGSKDEVFGLDEARQGLPHYEEGHLPIVHVDYSADGATFEETVLAHPLIADHRSSFTDEPGVAAYIRVTAKDAAGQVAFEVVGPEVAYGFPIVSGGFRNDRFTDGHNNVFAWFSPGATWDDKAKLVRFSLAKGESAYAVLPHQLQLAGTQVRANAENFEKARSAVAETWKQELAKGASVEVPEQVVMDAYRSLFIGDWQLSLGDELPYGMFNYYQGNGYAETLQYIAPFIEYGYFADARRFIQPIIEYPLSDTGIGLHVCANRLVLPTYYFFMSGDKEILVSNKARLIEVADFLLAHREKGTGLLLDGYGFDVSGHKVANLNTNTNSWRGIRDLAVAFAAIGEQALAEKYRAAADEFGAAVRQAIEKNIDNSTTPPFVPFALGEEKPWKSLVESKEASYYNLVFPYFFESEIFEANAAPYTHALEYLWSHQGVMAGLTRFDQHSTLPSQDGIHPLYTWGRQFSQILRHDAKRAIYTFYCALAFGYTRGTFLTGECQGTVPSETTYARGTYLPPEPPANALLLRSLRHMLVHERDGNLDGNYEQVCLLSTVPAAWLEDGKTIRLDKMPTRSGPISLVMKSDLKNKKISGEITLDGRAQGKSVSLSVRLPGGAKVKQAQLADGNKLQQATEDGASVLTLPAQAGTARFSIETE